MILCHELSDQLALTLHQVKGHDVRAFTASKAFQSGISSEQILSPCHWKSQNTFTHFYLKGVVWADSKLFHFGPLMAAQLIHQKPIWPGKFVYMYIVTKRIMKKNHTKNSDMLSLGGLFPGTDSYLSAPTSEQFSVLQKRGETSVCCWQPGHQQLTHRAHWSPALGHHCLKI